MTKKDSSQYTAKEASDRMTAALRGARLVGASPMKKKAVKKTKKQKPTK